MTRYLFQFKTEGPKGFFKGLVPIALRAWPANAVCSTFISYQ